MFDASTRPQRTVDVRAFCRSPSFELRLGPRGTKVKRLIICLIALALSALHDRSGTASPSHKRMDASDDANCRQQADRTVTYDQCRKNLMQLRQAAMANPGAGTIDMAGPMKEAGGYLQALSPTPPAAPTICQSTPWGGRCQDDVPITTRFRIHTRRKSTHYSQCAGLRMC